MSDAADDILDPTAADAGAPNDDAAAADAVKPDADGKASMDDNKPEDLMNLDGEDKSGDKDDQAGDGLSDDAETGDEDGQDKYVFEAPEGVDLDQDALDRFKELATELDLAPEQFQKIIEHDLQRSQQANEAAVAEWNSRVEGWKEASRTDKEIGGEDFAESKTLAQSSIHQFADTEFRALMRSPSEDNPNGLALINHPAVMRFLTRVGKVIADPTIITGDAPTPSEEAHDRLYPTMRQK